MYSAPPFKTPPAYYHTCKSNICKPELYPSHGNTVKWFASKSRKHVIGNAEYHDGYKTDEVDMHMDRPQIWYVVRPEQKEYAEGTSDKEVYNTYSSKLYSHLVSTAALSPAPNGLAGGSLLAGDMNVLSIL